jgi:hypothetical protein
MKKLSKQELEDLIRAVCYELDLNWDDSYSGRGMYGKSCLAVYCENGKDVHNFFIVLGRQIEERWEGTDVNLDGDSFRSDQLGIHGCVLYLPFSSQVV